MGFQITDIKSKWNAIRGQFRRKVNKVKSSKSGQSTDDLYVSQWLFWGKVQFLQSLMKTTKSRNTLLIGNDSFQTNASFSSDEESNDIGTNQRQRQNTLKERKKKDRKCEN